ncbi:hypothetical protein [Trichocoleus sp. FACHB-262]|uniref:hypothetical protein n=1 Tax=Trichocoleus sp. FACHB-262 TaxID=2692869 RepID=UPI00168769F9|nr:hypothetical protein [Trichocoleus sp. FACHB-262]MBD2124576.1 hypothetical protein [Trichocoleus sp. FACHB-262]
MPQLPKRLFYIAPRLLINSVVAISLLIVGYECFSLFVAPPLSNLSDAVQANIGFYLHNPNLVGKVSNLQCGDNGAPLTDYSYYCRFKTNSSNIGQFVKEKRLESGTANFPGECLPPYIDLPSSYTKPWWRPSDLEGRGREQCYFTKMLNGNTIELVYFSTSQLAYMHEND